MAQYQDVGSPVPLNNTSVGYDDVDLEQAESAKKALEAQARVHNLWLSQQLTMSAQPLSPSSQNVLLLPLPIPPQAATQAATQVATQAATPTETETNINLSDQFDASSPPPEKKAIFSNQQLLSPSDNKNNYLMDSTLSPTTTAATQANQTKVQFASPIMSTTLISPTSAKAAPAATPTVTARSGSYDFSHADELFKKHTHLDLCLLLDLLRDENSSGKWVPDSNNNYSLEAKKAAVASILNGDGGVGGQRLDALSMTPSLIFDLLFSCRIGLVPFSYLQGTPKKISESLEKLHSDKGIKPLFVAFEKTLQAAKLAGGAEIVQRFTFCFATGGEEPRIVRKINNLFSFISEQSSGGVGGSSAGATPGKRMLNISSGQSATPGNNTTATNTSRYSAAMKSYDEFGEESGMDDSQLTQPAKSMMLEEDDDEQEKSNESAGEGGEDEFDF